MLKSMMSAPCSATILAPLTSSSGTEPNSWMATGCSRGSTSSMAKVLEFLNKRALALTISDTV